MEKQEEMKAFAGMCSQALSDDVELRQEVELELLDHLEDAYEEERQDATEEEALKNAFKRFGNPEEISSQLVKNNAARLSRNARIRRAAKWLLLPLLIIGVLLCIDVRGIKASSFVLRPFLVKKLVLEEQGNEDYYDYSDGVKTRKLTADEQLLFDLYYNKERRGKIVDERAERLYKSNTDDQIYCATCALEWASSGITTQEQRSKLMAVLDNGRRIDGTNPLYDFIEAYMLMTSACNLSAFDGKELNGDAITDCNAFEKAVVIYKRALTMGPVKTYGKELQEKVRDMLVTRRDLLGGMQLLDFEMRERLTYISVGREISKRIPLYCEKLHADGKKKEALELLGTWRRFLLQFLEGNHGHYLDLLASVKYAERFLQSAKKLEAKDDIAALQAVVDWLKARRDNVSQSTDDFRMIRISGLLGGALTLPEFKGDESARRIERKLEAATFDVIGLGFACVIILLIIIGYGVATLVIRMNGRHPFLFVMSQDSYKSLFFKGILLPAIIYLLMCWIVAGIGGVSGVFWQLLPCVFLCLIWPIGYGVFCRRAINERIHGLGAMENHDFKASRSLNMMCLYVVLLVVIGGIIRPVQTWRQHHYARQDTLLFPWHGVETAEAKSIREGYQQLMKLLNTEHNK
ncbi:MAG: hypothetical protein IKZ46_11600 [Victivallales bacterium]|nr:hypothetical protein [Victivallales bacterium]